MGASAAYDDALDGGLADAAGFTRTAIDVVMELEESGNAFGVHVVGDGGTTQLNRVF